LVKFGYKLEEKLAKVYLALPGRVNWIRNQPLYNSVTCQEKSTEYCLWTLDCN
jgi:hypothetical protein